MKSYYESLVEPYEREIHRLKRQVNAPLVFEVVKEIDGIYYQQEIIRSAYTDVIDGARKVQIVMR